MHTHALRAGRRWYAFVVVAALTLPWALVASCTSAGNDHPGELGTQDSGSYYVDHYTAPETAPDTGPDVVDTGPDASDGEAEAACQPIGEAGVTVSANSLSFGDGGQVGCGTQAPPIAVTLNNDTCEPVTFTGTVSSGTSYYTITPATGPVPALGSQPIQVVPNPIPQTSAVTPDLYEGTVSITTTAPGDTAHIVQLHQTAYGAIITSTQFGNTLAFNGVPIGQTASAQFSVSNTGNASADVSFAVGSQFFTVSPTFTITPTKPATPQVTFSPLNVQPYGDTITTTVAGGTPLCAPPPPTTPLTGNGTTGILVSPVSLDFGLVQCGQPAAAYQTTMITNTGAACTYTLTFVKGINSPFTLADDATGNPITPGVPVNLGASSKATIRVVPKQILNPATTTTDGYSDTLTVTTTGPGDSPHPIALHETAQGAIFQLSPASISTSANGTTVFENFSVGNVGNLAAGYTLAAATTQGPKTTFSSNLTSGTLAAGATAPGVLTCVGPPTPDGGGTVQYLGTLTLTPNAGTVLCADPPPPMPLSITN
jgi:hypothetical protein